MNSVKGFVKVDKVVSGSFVHVHIWNPQTGEFKSVICDDYEYEFGMGPFVNGGEFTQAERETMLDMPYFGGSEDVRKAYEDWHYKSCLESGKILVGMTIEVVKGRKFPKGTTGVVKDFYHWYDQYGRLQTVYCVTTDGKRIPMQNCKPIA